MNDAMQKELEDKVGYGETVYWRGAPEKKSFVLHSIFNFLLPVAVIWGLIDIPFLVGFLTDDEADKWFIIPFFLLHLAPVWIYLGGVLFSLRRYRNTGYIVTDRAVYVSGGILSVNVEVKPLARLSNIVVRRGILDRKLNVGNIVIDDGETSYHQNSARRSGALTITGIAEYDRVYKLIRELQYNAASGEKNDPVNGAG